jgi:hypothetical protein
MKLLTRTLSLLTIASLALFFANCGGDDGDGTPTEKTQLGKLTGTWVLVSANLENGTPTPDKTADYNGFTLELSGTFDKDSDEPYPYSYTTTNRPDLSPWDAIGNWGFGSNPKEDILRESSDSGILGIKYAIDGETLTLRYTFTGDGFPSARAAEVEGNWTLVLELQD